jgi:predicted nucleotidyltransferase
VAKDREQALARFAERLEVALGKNLVAAVLYGSTARGTYVQGRSDLNVLVVVRDAGAAALRPAAEPIADWVKAGEPPPLVFSDAEWRASADVFPIEIEDMREAHRVLRGGDVFVGLATRRADLRQELEREVRGKLLRLRTEYAAAAGDGRELERLLLASASTFLTLFRAALRLAGRPVPSARDAMVQDAAAVAGMEAAAFDWVLARLAGRAMPALEPFDPVGVRYVDAIERLARFVDETPVGGDAA